MFNVLGLKMLPSVYKEHATNTLTHIQMAHSLEKGSWGQHWLAVLCAPGPSAGSRLRWGGPAVWWCLTLFSFSGHLLHLLVKGPVVLLQLGPVLLTECQLHGCFGVQVVPLCCANVASSTEAPLRRGRRCRDCQDPSGHLGQQGESCSISSPPSKHINFGFVHWPWQGQVGGHLNLQRGLLGSFISLVGVWQVHQHLVSWVKLQILCWDQLRGASLGGCLLVPAESHSWWVAFNDLLFGGVILVVWFQQQALVKGVQEVAQSDELLIGPSIWPLLCQSCKEKKRN